MNYEFEKFHSVAKAKDSIAIWMDKKTALRKAVELLNQVDMLDDDEDAHIWIHGELRVDKADNPSLHNEKDSHAK